eukprot:GFUD01108693.1.p1 GENE.GFUD01108693.1~~GFUD01108693.1.p1  ORF type:complete len:742 (-),score=162.00 GFUD01108693.1:40-2265(-)
MIVSLIFLSLISQACSLKCYACPGKKGQCQVSSDPGTEKECPSIQSLIRPSVMITLDAKWKNISANKNDKTMKKALLATYSELYATIPSFAILDQIDSIPDFPIYDELLATAGDIWKGITSKCQELGCKYSKKLESDQTALERNWISVSAKKNQLSMTRAATASFNNLAAFLPSPDNTEPAVNISEDTSKDDIVNITESVLSAIDADCIGDSCSYSEGLKTLATATLDSKWLEINSKKNATTMRAVLETSFVDFEKLLPMPEFSVKTSNITDNTTVEELKTIVEEFWTELNDECSDGNCKMSPDIKTKAISSLDTKWKEKFDDAGDPKDSVSITALIKDVYDSLINEYKLHYKTVAETAIANAAITDNTNYQDLMVIAGEVLTAISAECANTSCSFSSEVNTTVVPAIEIKWKAISPTENEILSVWKATLTDIRGQFYAHHYKLATDALTASVVEISDNSTFDELVNITESVLEKMNEECKNDTCTYSAELKSQVMTMLDAKWKELAVNKKDMIMVLNNAFGDVYQKLDTSASSPVTLKSAAITSKTTFEQLVNISDEALGVLIGDNADNGCTYLAKAKDDDDKAKKYFRNCLFYQKLALSDLPAIKIQLKKDTDPTNATICKEELCNNKGLYTCMVCNGPNNICKLGELGESKACASEEQYCIKELSGDSSNRELVARRCGTEFDREATCGSSGENIGIAAKGLVRCCSNREANDCNLAGRLDLNLLGIGILLFSSFLVK